MRRWRQLALLLLGAVLVGPAVLVSREPGLADAAITAADPIIMTAGDIACDPTNSNFNGGAGGSSSCRMLQTSNLIVGSGASAVLLLGDNQYYCGGYQAFVQSYGLSWGRPEIKSITRPSVGNHEYLTSGGTDCNAANAGADGYFRYFGAAAGEKGKGYYSYDIGAWHLIALNTQCSSAGGCGASSAQGLWLAQDLAAHPNFCTLAYWHIPLFSSGGRANNNSRPFWDQLYAAGVDVILTSHDHLYERFGKQRPDGSADSVRGIREWVVGSGGANHTSFTSTIFANSEVRDDTTFGVLKLTLHPTSYDWQFLPEAGKTFTDVGTTQCHGTSNDTSPPSAPSGLTATPISPGAVGLAWIASTDDVGISGYRVNRNGTQIATVTTTTYNDAGVQPGSTNSYTVVAVDSGGNVSQPSNTAIVTTLPDTTLPTAPTNLAASSTSGFQVNLTWGASSDDVGVAEYQVLRGGVIVGTSTSPSYVDATVDPLTAYSYMVLARDASNNVSLPSNVVSITTPAAPAMLTFAPVEDAYVQSDQPTTNFGSSSQTTVDASPTRRALLKFTVSGVRGRQVLSAKLRLYCVDPSSVGGAFHRVASSAWSELAVNWNNQPAADAATIASLGAVLSGITYEIDVASLVTGDGTYTIGADSSSTNGAYYSSREGSTPPQLMVTTVGEADTIPPTTPGALTATAPSPTRVDLAWTASTDNVGVTDYQIFRDSVPIATSVATSYSDTTAQPSTSYAYAVVARDAAANSSLSSNVASVTTPAAGAADVTPPTAPTNLSATAPLATRVDLVWTASTDDVGVTEYRVFRGAAQVGTSATTSYSDTTVQPSTSYSYTVVARDAATNASQPSNAASVLTPAATSATLTFTPVADAHVDDSAATTNNGTSTTLRVDGSPIRRAYLRLTVTGLSGAVTSARLRIYANSASSTGHQVHPVADTTWGETTITFANAPPIGAAAASSGSFAAGGYIEVPVTSLITGNGTYTLAMTTPSSTAISYGSRESVNKPQLVVTAG